MEGNIERLIKKIKQLDNELRRELHKKQDEFFYHIDQKKVRFEKEVRKQHKNLVKGLSRYFLEASLLNILTVPVIWGCLFPALLLDLCVTLFQAICFPVYKIPKVRRSKYIVIDRHALSYLNLIEKINCFYCGYFNGLLGYVQEVAARTEQYWCPIKHARPVGLIHSRYKFFFDYGDAEGFRQRIAEVRRDFADLEKKLDD
ncbi:MAG: hypothetical protein KKB30_03170 [Proteobacteria bacterium]|nr:hypothetical protein [Pseudomonadota bacterium]MBU1716103.1 hypothetical protein [Pseudomonadota bacterium]